MKLGWIAVDWGTTNLRVWAMSKDDTVLAQASSNRGMGSLKQTEFQTALLELIEPWLPEEGVVDVVACGMVGARQGWVEAAYGLVPCAPFAENCAISFTPPDPRLRVHIIAGLSQVGPADVMRGEETQIAGLLANNPNFKGVVCLPGTHTKWVRINDGNIISFTTHMTGEMFSLLSDKSVLRHTIADEGWNETEFSQTFNSALQKPEKITTQLFSIRAEALVGDLVPEAARARLSALLLGLEFAGTKTDWQGQDVAIIGSDHVAETYQRAFLLQSEQPTMFDAETLTLAGLVSAHGEIILRGK